MEGLVEVSSIASGLASLDTGSAVANSVLSTVNSLESDLVNRLFASLGVGTNINTLA